MAITVVTLATYLCGTFARLRGSDRDAQDFVKGLKGEAFAGYADIKVRGTYRRLKSDNLDDAINWFGEMAADCLLAENATWPIALVPVPNSGSVVGGPAPRTLRLAMAIKQNLQQSAVADIFRWKEVLPSAHQGGGTRDPAALYGNLELTGSMPKTPIILVDDVLTSGGHIKACTAYTIANGGKLLLAICGGRTVYEQKTDPFAMAIESVEEFTPSR